MLYYYSNKCVGLSKDFAEFAACLMYFTHLAIRLPCLAQPFFQKNVPDLQKIDTIDGGNILGHAVNVCPVSERGGRINIQAHMHALPFTFLGLLRFTKVFERNFLFSRFFDE